MPFTSIPQPEIITINENLRLRRYDGHYERFLPPYQNPYVYQNSEGIFDDATKPDLDYVKRMCSYLDRTGEFYYIEAKENDTYICIGDVTVKDRNPPIAIWEDKYRGKGIGTLIMQTVIHRLKTLGFKSICNSAVYIWNLPSQKMHESLGFRQVSQTERELIYELTL